MEPPTRPDWPTPSYAPPPSTPTANPWTRFTAWFTRQTTAIKAVVISSTAAVFLCICCSGLAAIGGNSTTRTNSQAKVATATHPADATTTATKAPTPKVTATAKPTATHAPAPKPTATKPPTATAINGNPWGYTFTNTGKLLYSPVSQFCSSGYFNCVSSFWTSTNGYVVQCNNGLFSHSGGVRNACSKDGGEGRAVYQR